MGEILQKMKEKIANNVIKNRRINIEIEAFRTFQSKCLTESLVLRDHLLFID